MEFGVRRGLLWSISLTKSWGGLWFLRWNPGLGSSLVGGFLGCLYWWRGFWESFTFIL
ncbi:hypothetical protein HMPREF0577_0297 [Mobiluncus mulieris ATCC 35243]|nr:hypothetical protein HMPREF0577_0297 [Mobiluncus mulieris ATCC 35243]